MPCYSLKFKRIIVSALQYGFTEFLKRDLIAQFDRRFGALQGAYNLLKRHGLQYYRTLARWPKLSAGKRAWYRVRYAPFFLYTGMLDWKTALANLRERPAGGHGGGTDERS